MTNEMTTMDFGPRGKVTVVPNGDVLAELAAERLQRGATGEPLEPIYLHPAV